MEIVIGTATIGSDYGVANLGKIQKESSAVEILSLAQTLGILDLDTAPDYANAEEIIGKYHASHPKFNCYSKISSQMFKSPRKTLESIQKSLELMRIDSLKGLYFHNPHELLLMEQKDVEEIIDLIEETGRVEKIGASIYELGEIIEIQARHPRITLFQVPENIADQRLRHSLVIKSMSESGIEFHLRSIFLQGLLLMKEAPAHLAAAQPFLDNLHEMALLQNCSRLDLCLNYVKQIDWASKIVVGISQAMQLYEFKLVKDRPHEDIKFSVSLPEHIRDPRRWQRH